MARRALGDAKRNIDDETWTIEQTSWLPSRLLHYEGLFTLGNGAVHVRGSLEEPLPGDDQAREYLRRPANVTSERHTAQTSHRGTYAPIVRDTHPLLNSVIVNLPSPLGFELRVNGSLLHGIDGNVVEQSRRLDMRQATLVRTVVWDTGVGTRLRATFTRFVSRERPELVVALVTLGAEGDEISVDVRASVDGDVRTNGYDHYARVRTHADRDVCSVACETANGSRAWVGSTLQAGPSESAAEIRADAAVRSAAQSTTVSIADGGQACVWKFSAVAGAEDGAEGAEALAARGLECLRHARAVGGRMLLAEHVESWRGAWRRADVEWGGDADEQRRLRFSIFQLLRTHRSGESRYAICPKGHAGEAYFGRYFWDTEIYLLPFYMHTHPSHARDLLRYRIQALPGAVRNARRYGYRGARYPWEADSAGDEHCPNWQYADHEIHVTADVVFAIRHYVRATGDESFLFHEALGLLVETSRYWADRIERDAEGRAVLIGVMGPDEYKPLSANNAFTNRLVRLALEFAAQALERCRHTAPETWKALVAKTGITEDEAAGYAGLAAEIVVPFDENRGIVRQSEDFESWLDVDIEELRAGAGDSRIGRGAIAGAVSQERLYRVKALKQADVVALLTLFPTEYSPTVRSASYEYYEPMTTHDSSLSASTHATLAAQLERTEEARAFWRHSLAVDASDQGDAEHGVHMANCGGNWQTVVYGFAGVSPAYATQELVLKPHLPAGVSYVRGILAWRGSVVRYEIEPGRVIVRLLEGAALDVSVRDERRRVTTEEKWTYEQ